MGKAKLPKSTEVIKKQLDKLDELADQRKKIKEKILADFGWEIVKDAVFGDSVDLWKIKHGDQSFLAQFNDAILVTSEAVRRGVPLEKFFE